jgi:hypothetical protein
LWAIRNRDGRGRQQIPVVEEFRYLGVVFHATKGVLCMLQLFDNDSRSTGGNVEYDESVSVLIVTYKA